MCIYAINIDNIGNILICFFATHCSQGRSYATDWCCYCCTSHTIDSAVSTLSVRSIGASVIRMYVKLKLIQINVHVKIERMLPLNYPWDTLVLLMIHHPHAWFRYFYTIYAIYLMHLRCDRMCDRLKLLLLFHLHDLLILLLLFWKSWIMSGTKKRWNFCCTFKH